jgi:hypothetical protein
LIRYFALFALLAGCAAIAVPASAEVTARDLQVAGRALGFVQNPPRGIMRVGIVYSAGVSPSFEQAKLVADILGTGLRAGNVDLRPVLVDVRNALTADVDLFYLTEHLDPAQTPLAGICATRGTPCITTDLAQVQAGICAIGIRSQPKVEIIVNRAAASASGVSFATAFRMLITEL